MRGESVEVCEGGVVEDLEAFALGYQEIGGWVGIREGGLIRADLLRVFRYDRRLGGGRN